MKRKLDPEASHDRGRITMNGTRHTLVFRHHPAWPFICASLVVIVAAGFPLATGDPEFRAALLSLNLLAPKVVVVTTVDVLALMALIPFTRRFWRSSWTFEVTDEHLIATHPFTGVRHTIAWGAITSVEKMRPVILAWGAPRQFSRIVLDDDTELLFAHHLDRYSEFVDELRMRVTCRVFNPYRPSPW